MRKTMKLFLGLALAAAPAALGAARPMSRRPSRHPDAARTTSSSTKARKPAEVLNFLGLKQGMRVIDMFGGNRYWAEIMAPAVGPKGQRHRLAADAILNDERRRHSRRSPRSSRTCR